MTPKNQASTSHTRLRKSEKKSYPGNRYDVWNELAAYYVQKTLVNDLKQKDRGVKRARFAVLKDIYCPGILIEGGFVSNAQEGRQIGSRNYRDKIAQAIVDGISSYHKTLRRVEAMK